MIADFVFEEINNVCLEESQAGVILDKKSLNGAISREEVYNKIKAGEKIEVEKNELYYSYDSKKKRTTTDYGNGYTFSGGFVEADIPDENVRYLAIENILAPRKGCPSVQRFYEPPTTDLNEALKRVDEIREAAKKGTTRVNPELLIFDIEDMENNEWFKTGMEILDLYGIIPQHDHKYSIFPAVALANIKDFLKEKEVWERLYDDHNGDPTPYAMDGVWNANGYQDLTADELHKVNLDRIKWTLENGWGNDPDVMIKEQPYAAPYIQEHIGDPAYVGMISGSDRLLQAHIHDYTDMAEQLKNNVRYDEEFYTPNENTYQEMVRTFYKKEPALEWFESEGYRAGGPLVCDYTHVKSA